MTHHVLDQLPLWVEGDLGTAKQTEVDVHLAACPACRAEADRLQASQAWLREALASPFGTEDHAALQASVLAQLAEPGLASAPRPLRWRRPALLAGLAALALLALPRFLAPSHPAATPGPPQPSMGAAPASSPPPVPARLSKQARARPRTRPHPVHPDQESSGSPAPARIEFQTADPTIRIIWLAQAKPLPEANPPTQEAP